MKKLSLFTILLFCSLTNAAFAQVPNASFESWNIFGFPDGWFGDPTTGTISKSSDAHTGSAAIQGTVLSAPNDSTFSPGMITGTIDIINQTLAVGFPLHSRPASLRGFLKLQSVSTDAFEIFGYAWKDSNTVAFYNFVDSTSHSNYVEFAVPILYLDETIPDSAIISVSMSNSGGLTHVGSSFILDDLTFSSEEVRVAGLQPTAIELKQNYPNPFNPTTTIEYTLPEASDIAIDLIDVGGRTVRTLASGFQSAGTHRIRFDADGLASGAYQYVLRTKNARVARVLQIVK